VAAAVGEERRRPVDSASDTGQEVASHPLLESVLFELDREALDVEPERLRAAQQVFAAEPPLILEEWSCISQKRPYAAADSAASAASKACGWIWSRGKLRKTEIAVLDERQRRLGRTANVVARADGNRELRALGAPAYLAPSAARASSAFRIPSAPGFTSTGET